MYGPPLHEISRLLMKYLVRSILIGRIPWCCRLAPLMSCEWRVSGSGNVSLQVKRTSLHVRVGPMCLCCEA